MTKLAPITAVQKTVIFKERKTERTGDEAQGQGDQIILLKNSPKCGQPRTYFVKINPHKIYHGYYGSLRFLNYQIKESLNRRKLAQSGRPAQGGRAVVRKLFEVGSPFHLNSIQERRVRSRRGLLRLAFNLMVRTES
jgi:hypothetical protein